MDHCARIYDQSIFGVIHKSPHKIINKMGLNGWKVVTMSTHSNSGGITGHQSYVYVIMERDNQ